MSSARCSASEPISNTLFWSVIVVLPQKPIGVILKTFLEPNTEISFFPVLPKLILLCLQIVCRCKGKETNKQMNTIGEDLK